MAYWSTLRTSQLLGVTVATLSRAVWLGRFKPPEKSPSGAYLWTEEDIERASWALRHTGIDDIRDQIGDSQSAHLIDHNKRP